VNRRDAATRPTGRAAVSGMIDQGRGPWRGIDPRPSTTLPFLSPFGILQVAPRPHDIIVMPTKRAAMALVELLILFTLLLVFVPSAEAQKFRADEWITECDRAAGIASGDCSITIPFWQDRGEARGSFALVIMLQTGNIGIVGQPIPLRAVLRIDKNPPIECRQARYCIFPSMQALAALKQLKVGTLILIDVFTARGVYKFSLTPKGYQAGVAQIRAWGYRIE
jgi:hypothetical protein